MAPPDSYPVFGATNFENFQRTDNYEKVEPHAFVHFISPKAVTKALDVAGHGELIFNGTGSPLKVSLGGESPFFINDRQRTISPINFSNVCVEIGTLVSQNEFWIGWKAPASGVDFLVDPFDDACKFTFTQETAFLFKDTTNITMIKCDFKLEFLVREITEIKESTNRSSLVVVLQLSSSPCLFYRTADDDIHVKDSYNVLYDDDPWIRTTDVTDGAIGRCNYCRISMSPRYGLKLKQAMGYLKDRQIPKDLLKKQLIVRDGPKFDYGMPISNPFFCIQYKGGISFEVMFLVNAAMHKGIFNQHQLSEEFFQLLRSEPRELNIAALRHICSYKSPVFDCYKKLKIVQEWLLKNPYSIGSIRSTDDNVEVRKLVITPTKAYCLPPTIERSDRVLRKYKEVSDRFLRVTFTDVLSYYIAPIVKDVTSIPSLRRQVSLTG